MLRKKLEALTNLLYRNNYQGIDVVSRGHVWVFIIGIEGKISEDEEDDFEGLEFPEEEKEFTSEDLIECEIIPTPMYV